MVELKLKPEVARIRQSCRIVEDLLYELREVIKEGITTLEIERFCLKRLKVTGAVSALKGYKGFPASVCVSINNVAAHGIPSESWVLRQGDLVSVDITVEMNGWHGDSAWTYGVGRLSDEREHLRNAAWQSMAAGILASRAGVRLGDVGHAINRAARIKGCRVLEEYVGHGIGRNVHEEPMVLNFGEPCSGAPVVPGMVFTIEPIVTTGNGKTRIVDDGWTIVTCDGGVCAQFEHTIAVFGTDTEVLTMSRFDIRDHLYSPPF